VVFFTLFWLGQAPAWAVDRGALFKVTGGGHSMYLFGTMHVGLPEFYPLEPRIAQAVAAAPTLALEIDPALAPREAAGIMQRHGMAAAGADTKPMPPALKARLADTLRKAGIDPAKVAPLKPWMLAMLLTMNELTALGYRADLAVDIHLATLARAGKAKVVALESIGAQMALFDRMSDEEQWSFLDEALKINELDKQRAEMREVVDAWRTADQAALDSVAERAANNTSLAGRFTQQVLLDGRNGAMADKLVALLARENNAVAAVGVLHLLGKHGVPALMRARGVTVERVY
jgi:uncharacterized protein YbaP (TraB family)